MFLSIFCYILHLRETLRKKPSWLYSMWLKTNSSYTIIINMNLVLQSILIYQIPYLEGSRERDSLVLLSKLRNPWAVLTKLPFTPRVWHHRYHATLSRTF